MQLSLFAEEKPVVSSEQGIQCTFRPNLPTRTRITGADSHSAALLENKK